MKSINIAILCSVCCMILLSTPSDGVGVRRGFTYILHTNAMTWNEALAVCENSGMTLFNPMSLQKSTDFKQIYDFWLVHGATVLEELWIGLYDLNPPTMNFTWTDCCMAMAGSWASWSANEPNNGNFEHCVRIFQGKEWKTRSCTLPFAFVCETDSDGCDFELLSNTSLDIGSNIEVLNGLSWDGCKDRCLYLHTAGEECVAFSYTNNNSCLIQRATQIYITTLPNTNSMSGATTAVKRCYDYSIDNTGTATANTDAVPNNSCSVHEICSDPLFVLTPTRATTTQPPNTTVLQYTATEILQTSDFNMITTTDFATPLQSLTPLISSSGGKIHASSITQSVATGYIGNEDTVTSSGLSILPSVTLLDIMSTIATFGDITLQPASVSDTGLLQTSEPVTSLQESYPMPDSTSTVHVDSTVDHRSSIVTEATSTQAAVCPCICFTKGNKSNVYHLFEHLRLNRRDLSSFRRSITSAEDPRPSARAVGSVLGVGILIVVALVIIILDVNYIAKILDKSKISRSKKKY